MPGPSRQEEDALRPAGVAGCSGRPLYHSYRFVLFTAAVRTGWPAARPQYLRLTCVCVWCVVVRLTQSLPVETQEGPVCMERLHESPAAALRRVASRIIVGGASGGAMGEAWLCEQEGG